MVLLDFGFEFVSIEFALGWRHCKAETTLMTIYWNKSYDHLICTAAQDHGIEYFGCSRLPLIVLGSY